jgi:hypothetical protein
MSRKSNRLSLLRRWASLNLCGGPLVPPQAPGRSVQRAVCLRALCLRAAGLCAVCQVYQQGRQGFTTAWLAQHWLLLQLQLVLVLPNCSLQASV